MRERRRMLVCCTLVAAMVVPGAAQASRRSSVIANTDKAAPLTGWTAGPDGGPRLGVHLANTPGGFYMGRLFKGGTAFTVGTGGQTFDRHLFSYNGQTGDVYHGSKSEYAWGYAVGQIGSCLWLGPSNGEPAYLLNQYVSPSAAGPDRCTQSQLDFLKGGSGGNIGSHFNCDPTSAANFGTRKRLLQDANLYYGIQWGGSTGYDGGPGVNLAGRITAASNPDVYYRYTTRDGKMINVYVQGWGWGFMPVGVLDRSRTNVYNRPGNANNIPCTQG